jgi:ABC-type polysaccharide/polyol phosphate transport system ATPase subunit
MSASISAERVGVRFLLDRQSRLVTPALARVRRTGTEVWGVRDASFAIGPGEAVALVGPSGAGKTTLLRVLAGVFPPDRGRVDVRGRVGSLLSTEAGLIPFLTGSENAQLLGVLAGLSRAAARAGLASVRERSGLGDAFERPVASYSQGMLARLGFAVVESARPEVLLLDEVHEALDGDFRDVLEESASELVRAGGIVVATGHDHALLARLCSRALLVRDGRVEASGAFGEIAGLYEAERGTTASSRASIAATALSHE